MMAFQNIVATFLGALLADRLIVGVQNPLVVGLIVVACAFLAFTVQARNYFLYLFFFTILILLLVSIERSGQSYALWRIVTILLGAGIVLGITSLAQIPFFGRQGVFSEKKEAGHHPKRGKPDGDVP